MSRRSSDPAVVLGAGLAGLAAAHDLAKRGERCLVFEREDRPGGLCRSIDERGFQFDLTGHFLHFRDASIRAWVEEMMGSALMTVRRRAWVWSHGAYTHYPFQANLFGLPSEVVKECLVGLAEAHAKPRRQTGAPDFGTWARDTFGEGIAKHFMTPYNTKLFGIPLRELTCEWMDRFVPRPSVAEAIEGALAARPRSFGYNATFLYPREGGIQRLVDRLAARVPGIVLGAEVRSVDPRRREVTTTAGTTRYRRLISTLPLPALARITRGLPASLRNAAKGLRARTVITVNLAVRGRVRPDVHWVYVPEPAFGFYRVVVPTNVCPAMAPRGCSILSVEFSAWNRGGSDAQLVRSAVSGLRRMALLRANHRVLFSRIFRLRPAYVVFDRRRTPAVAALTRHFSARGIHSVGRYGAWTYSSMEDALLAGRRVAVEVHRSART